MAADDQAVPQNQITNWAAALSPLATTLFGTGTKTTSQSESPSSGATANSDSVLSQAMQMINSSAATDPVVQAIMTNAANTFGSQWGAAPNNAGMYSSNVYDLLKSNAMANATNQASQAVLDSQNKALQSAAQVTNAQLAATKTTTGTSKQAGLISPTTAMSVLGPVLAKSALNHFAPDFMKDPIGAITGKSATNAGINANTSNAADTAVNGATQSELGGAPAADTSGLSAGASTAGEGAPSAGIDASAALGNSGAGTSLASVVDPTATGLIDPTASAAATAAGTDLGSGAIAPAVDSTNAASADVGFNAFGDSTAGITTADAGVGAAAGAGLDAAGALGASAGVDAGVAAAGDAAAGSGILDAITSIAAAWIICTELMKQGRFPRKAYMPGARVFMQHSEIAKQGYYLWAIPSVQHLRKYPNSLYSKLLQKVFSARANQIIGTKSLLGLLTLRLLPPVCFSIGCCMNLLKVHKNLSSIYPGWKEQ